MGLNYLVKEKFVFGNEILPFLVYYYINYIRISSGKEWNNKTSGFNYGFSSSSVLISLAFRF